MNKKKKVVNTSIYPDEVIERLARCFYPAILECFNSEEGQRAFAAWQAEQARSTAKEKQDVPTGERPVLHSNCQRLFSDEAHPSGCAFLLSSGSIRHCLTCPALWYSFGQGTAPWFSSPKKTKNPYPSPIRKGFGFSWFGAMEGTRTPGLLSTQDRDTVGRPATGDGLRQWYDLLVQTSGSAGSS